MLELSEHNTIISKLVVANKLHPYLRTPYREPIVFSTDAIEKGVRRAVEDRINRHRFFGTLHSDMTEDDKHHGLLDLSLISHKVTSLWWEDDETLAGSVTVLDTPKGRIVKELMADGMDLFLVPNLRYIGRIRCRGTFAESEKRYNPNPHYDYSECEDVEIMSISISNDPFYKCEPHRYRTPIKKV